MPDFLSPLRAYFAHPDVQPVRLKDLAKLLRVKQSQAAPFKAAIQQMIDAGELQAKSGILSKRGEPDTIEGTIRRTSSGAGYFRPTIVTAEDVQTEAVYVAPHHLGGAMTGDTVRIRILRRQRSEGQLTGRVMEITKRAKTTFVGVYHEQHKRGFVTLDGAILDAPVSVGDPGAKGAKPNDKVVIEMLRYPSDGEMAEGVITQVLGPRGAPGVDCLSIIHEFNLPDEFPETVLEDARAQARRFNEHDLGDRVDLTRETIVTIDPVDARDFDDAISLEKNPDGSWRLGVHIADVAFFVQPGSPLDLEAQNRGNSVYLPDRVLPMLPEILSNALASLQQDHVRFTKTAFIEFTPDGIPTHTELANTAIKVTRRFAYEEVMPIIAEPDAYRGKISEKVLDLLIRMHELAMILRKRRFDRGALDLSLPEVKIDFDNENHVRGAHTAAHDESHEIIEEFMLAANIAVATQISLKGFPYLSRTHAAPDEKKLRMLGEFLQSMGHDVKPWAGRAEIQKVLNAVRGTPVEYAVSYATLRSLKQAEYSPQPIGHFALNEPNYCHFTSPIRRYPDLTIHRLVDELVQRHRKPKIPSETELAKIGEQCSMTERRAESAERELIKVKLQLFLKDKIGWKQHAMITGVERFGLFCQGIELPAEGLVHIKRLPDDQYDYEGKSHTLIGRRSGTVYRLGDRVMVEVAAVDLHKRLLEYKLVVDQKPPRPAKSRHPSYPKKPRRR
ncbi:MAG TPA: ribonuclease R [Planctomycetaceae bacterium]|nr:ribonuclease R [Planctomycetaceae bacterium]